MTVTSNKDDELKAATETARLANFDMIAISDGRRNLKKALIFTMKKGFKFQDWSCDNRQLRPQVEGILCIFVDLPIFFSLVKLEALLGYKAGNNNVKMALQKMVDEDMLIVKEDHTKTQKYYLGTVARAILENRSIPDICNTRPTEHAESAQACIDAGKLHANERGEEKENKKGRQNRLSQHQPQPQLSHLMEKQRLPSVLHPRMATKPSHLRRRKQQEQRQSPWKLNRKKRRTMMKNLIKSRICLMWKWLKHPRTNTLSEVASQPTPKSHSSNPIFYQIPTHNSKTHKKSLNRSYSYKPTLFYL